MYPDVRETVRGLLEKALREQVPIEDVTESDKADYASTIAFRLAAKQGRSPLPIAQDIASKITPSGIVKKVEAAGGYVNFFIDYSIITAPLLEDVRNRGASYGRAKSKGIKVVLEHTSINPSGPLHIGRLRNCLIGDCLARVLRFTGYEVETHYFVNDVGKQIAIIAQGFREGVAPDSEALRDYSSYAQKEDFKVFFEYVAANRRFEEDPGFAARVQELILKAESGDAAALSDITDVAKRCLSGQKEIYDFLDVRFDVFDYESAYIRNGAVLQVLKFLRESSYAKDTDKGFGLDLTDYGLARRDSVTILSRPDKTSVYLSRDIAYHLEKAKLGDVLINVLGEDHKFEFQELETILTKIYGIGKRMEAVHYSFVNFEGVELSTRKGQTAPVDKLLDEAVKKAGEEIEARGIASKNAAPVIAIGAVKYHILKTSPHKTITFRWQDALSFEGDAAPYIQYAHARCCSIVEKSRINPAAIDVRGIDVERLEKEEESLIRMFTRFPDLVERTAEERRPNLLANYLYELAAAYSRFYKDCPVLSADEAVKNRRLMLVDASRQVLANGLLLLGIESPKKM